MSSELTPLTAQEREALEGLATAATQAEWQQGKWEHDSHDHLITDLSVAIRGRESTDLHGVWVAEEEGNLYTAITGNGPRSEANAAYIAAANPDTLLRLLAQLRAAEARWERLKVELEDYANQRGDEATSTYRLGAKSMAHTAVNIMTRLEQEREG